MSCKNCEHMDMDDTWGYKCYCSYYKNYMDPDGDTCSHFSSRGGGGCFMTTACCEYYGLPDNCAELTAMRKLRDDYVGRTESGRAEIQDYYAIAPGIVERIGSSARQSEIYPFVYQCLRQCQALVDREEYEPAARIYRAMVKRIPSDLDQN